LGVRAIGTRQGGFARAGADSKDRLHARASGGRTPRGGWGSPCGDTTAKLRRPGPSRGSGGHGAATLGPWRGPRTRPPAGGGLVCARGQLLRRRGLRPGYAGGRRHSRWDHPWPAAPSGGRGGGGHGTSAGTWGVRARRPRFGVQLRPAWTRTLDTEPQPPRGRSQTELIPPHGGARWRVLPRPGLTRPRGLNR